MKDKRVSQVVALAMSNLPRDLVLKCCEEDWFVTMVGEPDGYPVTIVDTTRKHIKDYKTFCEESVNAYNEIYREGFGWVI